MDVKRINAEEVLKAYPAHKDGLLVLPSGIKTFWKNRKLHNEDGPAVIYPNGYGCEYYRKGLLHRETDDPQYPLPAVQLDSRLEYYWWGKLHNVFAPAIHDPDRNIQVWAQHGKKHQYQSPAVIHEPEGYIGYWEMGERHRLDGPARIWLLEGRTEWWIKGKLLTQEELEKVEKCFEPNSASWPLLFGHPVLRPIAEYVKAGGVKSQTPDTFIKFEKRI